MNKQSYNVLFLCTGNSARSIFGEALLNHRGEGRFRAYSAGSHPAGQVNPMALNVLEQLDIPTEGLRSKSWDEFIEPGAPVMDFVFTVCDKAATETCPVWPGRPVSAHWGIPDPAAVEGDEATRLRAFRQALHAMDNRIRLFLSLSLERLAEKSLKEELQRIGEASA
ncbi:MAG TPA: arsenate reductase ArsC [Gammaproteobacteria bacterium]|nr:arsenate reductase ArsC [Gammaproteobacteria bacterium]